MSRWLSTGAPARAVRAVLALTVALGCLGAVAYAASRPEGSGRPSVEADPGASQRRAELGKKGGGARPPRPKLATPTQAVDPRPAARFKFTAPGEGLRFVCQLDRGGWKACQSPHRVRGLGAGPHSFAVRAVRKSRRGPSARFAWTKVDPRQLTVEPHAASLAPLRPGDPAQTIPVRIANPNTVPVTVTAVKIVFAGDPPGCPADPNFELRPASLSPLSPVVLPAGGELSLPTATISAPAIALRELPLNQDACQGASVPLRFDAEAHG